MVEQKKVNNFYKKWQISPIMIVAALSMVAVVCTAITLFYRSLEREIYAERAAYLQEITKQIVSTANSVSSAQNDLAVIFSNHLREEPPLTEKELSTFIEREEEIYAQQGLSLLAFDERGNYYNGLGNRSRWLGSIVRIDASAPEDQVEITTLPSSTGKTDEMVFVHRMGQPVMLAESSVTLTHVAVVRDMGVFHEAFQTSSFSGEGESYIISATGMKVYREQTPSAVIGDVFNVLKPLEKLSFQYDGSYEALRRSVVEGESCSLVVSDNAGERYYVTTHPMSTNGWSMLSIIPSDAVNVRMQDFMRKTLLSVGTIALVIIIVVSFAIYLILRFYAGQKMMQQQVAANAALREAAREAEEASRAKTVFLSHMSHDIRTPINGIMGMADIATSNMNDSKRVADCLGKITSASRHLLSLINDVLDMSRIESGKVQLEEKPFYLDTLLDGCHSVVAGQALEKKLDLRTDFTGVTKLGVQGDELHLRQILINILGNAVKFTPERGKVEFIARGKITDDGQADITILIRDNGIGMTKEFQQKIFDPFVQEEGIARSNYQGTGLGMSIVKQLLDLMGGTVKVESRPGEGSAFTVRLRLPVVEMQKRAESSGDYTADLTGMRLLLVEDNELNMEIAQFMLEDCGIEVTSAWNGQEAVDTFVRQPEGSFDVILMDVMMPVMDGLSAARAIRASQKGDAKTIPIVAMTANAFAEDREAVMEAGMNKHLAKPIERKDLIQTVGEYADQVHHGGKYL